MMELLYQYSWIFFTYAFLGWCTEVIYAAASTGKFTNRGFLNGPICPIYGIGGVILIYLLMPLKSNLLLLFLASVAITSILEFITGYLLEKFFHQKWWDYSDYPFNIKGYISLKFSLLFGLAGVIVIYVIQPIVMLPVEIIPVNIGRILLVLFFIATFSDLIVTILALMKIKKELVLADIIETKLNDISEFLGNNLYEGTIKTKEGLDQAQDELAKIKESYERIIEENRYYRERIIKAFPDIKGMIKKSLSKDEDEDKGGEK